MSIEERGYELPDGSVIDDCYHFARPNYVLVIAKDNEGKILIERQYRRGVDDFVYEVPSGWIEDGEDPVKAGERELLEETGYKGDAKLIGKIYVQAGYSSQIAYVVLVENITDAGGKKLDSDEEIETQKLSTEEVDEMIKSNEMKDMGALSALELYEKTRET